MASNRTRKRVEDWKDFNSLNLSAWVDTTYGREDKEKHLAALNEQEAAAEEFLKAKVPDPDSNAYYTPTDYFWQTNPLIRGLERTHRAIHGLKWGTALAAILGTLTLLYFIVEDHWLAGIPVLAAFFALSGFLFVKLWKLTKSEGPKFEARLHAMAEVFLMSMRYQEKWVRSRYDIDLEFASFGVYGNSFFVKGYNGKEQPYCWKEIQRGKFIIASKETGEEAPLLSSVRA